MAGATPSAPSCPQGRALLRWCLPLQTAPLVSVERVAAIPQHVQTTLPVKGGAVRGVGGVDFAADMSRPSLPATAPGRGLEHESHLPAAVLREWRRFVRRRPPSPGGELPGGYSGRGSRKNCSRVSSASAVRRLIPSPPYPVPAMSEKGELDLTGAKQNTGMWLVKVRSRRRNLRPGPARPVATGPTSPHPHRARAGG